MTFSVYTRWLIALVVVLVASVAWLEIKGEPETVGRASQLSAARSAASETLPLVLSYRHDDLESYAEGVELRTAGAFRSEFRELLPRLSQRSQDKKVVIRTELSALGVSEAEDGKVTLLAFVNQSTQERGSKVPTLQGVRLRIVMEENGGSWVLTAMTPI